MSKHAFKRKHKDVDYEVLAESLPSGSACFTFVPALPGRTPVIMVEKEVVEDLVRCYSTGSEYDLEHDAIVLSLTMVDTCVPTPDQPEFGTAVEAVPAQIFLAMVLDEILTPCDDCENLNFGEDVVPEEPKVEAKASEPEAKPKKTYLN